MRYNLQSKSPSLFNINVHVYNKLIEGYSKSQEVLPVYNLPESTET